MALLASGFAWVESYQPLASGNYAVDVRQPHAGPAGEDAVRFRSEAPFEFGFSVMNGGAFAVRVVDGPHLLEFEPYKARLYVSGPLAHAHEIPGPLTPFRPFDLPPGEQCMLVLKGTFSKCRAWAGQSGFAIDSLPVTFSFLWHTEEVRIPLNSELVVQIPAGRRCLR